MPQLETIEQVHKKIVLDACDIANHDTWVIENFGGPVFIPGHEQRYSLVMTWDPGVSFSDVEIIKQLHVKGKSALHQSIKQNEKIFVGLVLGLARKGENYFDIFER